VNPATQTVYTVIVESQAIFSGTVVVHGGASRSGRIDLTTLESEYLSPLRGRARGTSYTTFLERVLTTLQSEMRASIDAEFELPRGTYVFVTHPRAIDSGEQRNRSFRVSYAVLVDRPSAGSADIVFSVRARIEFRRRSEETWYRASCCEIHHPIVDGLMRRLQNAVPPRERRN